MWLSTRTQHSDGLSTLTGHRSSRRAYFLAASGIRRCRQHPARSVCPSSRGWKGTQNGTDCHHGQWLGTVRTPIFRKIFSTSQNIVLQENRNYANFLETWGWSRTPSRGQDGRGHRGWESTAVGAWCSPSLMALEPATPVGGCRVTQTHFASASRPATACGLREPCCIWGRGWHLNLRGFSPKCREDFVSLSCLLCFSFGFNHFVYFLSVSYNWAFQRAFPPLCLGGTLTPAGVGSAGLPLVRGPCLRPPLYWMPLTPQTDDR